MSITAADFFIVHVVAPWDGPDTDVQESLDTERLTRLIAGPEPGLSDLDAALALMDLVRDDLHLSGTSGGERLSTHGMRLAVRALERTSGRAGHPFSPAVSGP